MDVINFLFLSNGFISFELPKSLCTSISFQAVLASICSEYMYHILTDILVIQAVFDASPITLLKPLLTHLKA